ncbi:type II toxin-antitoxin system VapC family toxin [bacterium]|nr:type II toxin-antitoxin system VapC family toxin [bacterium]
MDFLSDTNFLIGRWRSGKKGTEQVFIDLHPDAAVGLPWIVKAEFLRGAELAAQPIEKVSSFLDRYQVFWPDEETLRIYAHTYAELMHTNQMIGPHDLWIAASALRAELPLLTRNVSEFRRVPNLRVEDYAASG